jgi:hypothetical protein
VIARVSVEELESENVGCFGEGDNILFIVALLAFYRHKYSQTSPITRSHFYFIFLQSSLVLTMAYTHLVVYRC